MRTRSRARRVAVGGLLLLAGGGLWAGPGSGCLNFAAESALSAADFCFIFDCTNGIFGGVVDPCASTGGRVGDELLVDCP